MNQPNQSPGNDPNQPGPQPQRPAEPPKNPVWEPPVYRSQQDSSKAYWVLSYIGILWLVGLVADRGNPRTRFHVNQGILLSMLSAALGIVNAIWCAIFNAIFGVRVFGTLIGVHPIGVLLNTVFSLAVTAVLLGYAILGIVHAVQGKETPLPIIGKLFVIVK